MPYNNSPKRQNLATRSTDSIKRKLMAATSAGIITLVAPVGGTYGLRSWAQVNTLPTECSDDTGLDPDNNNDGVADDAETIDCSGGSTIDPVLTDVDDLTVTVGGNDPASLTLIRAAVGDTTPVISMDGSGDQSLTLRNSTSVNNLGSADAAIYVRSDDGNVTFNNVDGYVTGDGYAIQARVGEDGTYNGGDLTINSGGNLYGSVYANNTGTGYTNIDIDHIVTNTNDDNGYALEVLADDQANHVTVAVGDVTTGTNHGGVRVENDGLGDTTITVTGDINTQRNGVRLYHYADGVGKVVVGDENGGSITSAGDKGVWAKNNGGTRLEVEIHGALNTDRQGVLAQSWTGDVSVITTENGDITNAGGRGIDIFNAVNGGATYVKTEGDITASNGIGLVVSHSGDEAVSVFTSGAIQSTGNAILITNSGGSTLVDDDTALDDGEYRGVYLKAAGQITTTNQSANSIAVNANASGNLTIVTTEDGDINSAGGGIFARNEGADVLISTKGTVAGAGSIGIEVYQDGTGTTKVEAFDDVSGYLDTIFVNSKSRSGDVDVKTHGKVKPIMNGDGHGHGIDVLNRGVGSTAITIEETSTVYAYGAGIGIDAYNGTAAGDVTVNVSGDVNAVNARAIQVANNGVANSGLSRSEANTTITTYSTSQITSNNQGIFATQDTTTHDLIITIGGGIDAKAEAVAAYNLGSGDTYLYLNGDIESETGAVTMGHEADGASKIVNTGNITAGTRAVYAINYAGSSMTFNNAGSIVTNTDGEEAVFLSNGERTGSLSIDPSPLPAFGDLSITTAANSVIDAGNDGIVAENFENGGDLVFDLDGTINTVSTTIDGAQYGAGIIDLVTQAGSRLYSHASTLLALETNSYATGMELDLDGALFGGTRAVSARSFNGADVLISVQGRVIGASEGIRVLEQGSSSITVANGGTVAGGVTAVSLVDAAIGLGITSIQVADENAPGGMATIVLQSRTVDGFNANELIDSVLAQGESLSELLRAAANGLSAAISFEQMSADDTLTLEAGGEIIGRAMLRTGDDIFNYSGGVFDYVFGGGNLDTDPYTDTVNFSGAARTLTNSGSSTDSLQEFEIFNFYNTDPATVGITLAGTHTGLSEANFQSGITILDGDLTATTATIAMNATLNARDGATFTGNLFNYGRLDIGSSPGRFEITGNFTQGATGVLPIEIIATAYDQLYVDGSATLAGLLDVYASNLPDTVPTYLFLDTTGGISGAFDTIQDNVPDLDLELTQTGTQISATFVPISDDGGDDDGDDSDDDDSDDSDDDSDDGGSGDGDSSDDDSDDVTPVIGDDDDEEPLLSPKEIVPSGLNAAMRAGDLFAETLIARRTGPETAPGDWRAWGSGFGGQHDIGQRGGLTGWDGDTNGFAIGLERLSTKHGVPVLVGLAGGYTRSGIDSDLSHARIESGHLGGFANAEFDRLFLAGALSYGWHEFDFERVIFLTHTPVVASSSTTGHSWAIKGEARYDLLQAQSGETVYTLSPLFTLDATLGDYDGFTETGAGILNLTYVDEHAYQAVTGLGADGRYASRIGGAEVEAGLRVVWESLRGDRSIRTNATLSVPGAAFQPASAALDANFVSIGADARIHLTDRIAAYIRYDTARGQNLIDQAGWAGLTVRF